jgi:aldehyde:ferredoxin oxidoreductase
MPAAQPAARTCGYHGRVLRVDLASGRGELRTLDEGVLRRFLGGSGLGTWLLLRERADAHDPLAPQAPIAFAFSPLVGSPVTTSAKLAVVSKSPLTERINDSLAGGAFAVAGKQNGCDAILISGRAAEPAILIVDDGQVHLEPAGDLWSATCGEAQQRLRERLDDDFQIAVIGPAGVQQVRYATISFDGRQAGRGGGGAVLGSKNLKAVAVRGSRACTWARAKELFALADSVSGASLGPATAKYRELGTLSNLLVFNRLGTLPTRNFRQGRFEGAHAIAPESLALSQREGRPTCAACTIGCEHVYHPGGASDGASRDGVRLEYESVFALGSLCGIDDPDVVARASHRCDELGLDTISTGGTIAFAMECVERGLLDSPGLEFGNGPALLETIDRIARRTGVGAWLAEGSRKLAQRIGSGSIAFAPQVKGLEMPGYEPRVLQTMALGLAIGARGADHNRSGAYDVDFSERVDRRRLTPEDAALAAETEDRAALMDSLILCKFLRGVFVDLFSEASEMLNLVTGWDTTPQELQQTVQRIVTAKKLFNIRCGWTPEEDTLPARFLDEALSDDATAQLPREHLAALVQAYNRHRGWTADGHIEEAELQRLDLAGL